MESAPNQPELFTRFIDAGLQEMLARVRSAENLVDDEDRQQAWHLLSFALDVEKVWPATRDLLLALAPKMEQAGFRKGWLLYLMEGYRQSQAKNDWQTCAECEMQIGMLYRMMSNFDEAAKWVTASIDHFVSLGNRPSERHALNELAWLEQLQHKYTEASQHVERALVLSSEDDIARGMSLRVQGMIAFSQRQWQKARAYHEQALTIFEQCKDQRRIAWSLQNLAISLNEQSEVEKAIALYKQAVQILDAQGDTYHVAIIEMNLGVAHQKIDQPTEGLLHLTKAATVFHLLSDTLNIARVETNLGTCQYALHNYLSAEQAFLTAINVYRMLGDQAWRLNAVSGLGMTYIANRQYNKAIKVLEEAISEIDLIKAHPYYDVTLNYLQQYLAEARQGQG